LAVAGLSAPEEFFDAVEEFLHRFPLVLVLGVVFVVVLDLIGGLTVVDLLVFAGAFCLAGVLDFGETHLIRLSRATRGLPLLDVTTRLPLLYE
jgi:hypothetical protein